MASCTEVFIFQTETEKRLRTIQVLKELQLEIIEAANGSVVNVRTLIGADDETTISQIYEWNDHDKAKQVNDLFFGFKSAKELQSLNKNNIYMGQLLDVPDNCFEV